MFVIENGRKAFYQWDINQRLIVENETILEVHFSNATITTAIEEKVYTDNGKRVVNVPNILLQSSFDLKVYGCCADCVRYDDVFQVVARNKPADYVYYELSGKQQYEELENRIEVLEQNTGIGVDMTNYYTKAETNALLDGIEVEADLSNYYTKAETDAAIKAQTPDVDLTGYATEKYVNDAIGAIPQPDMNKYALKTDIPNTSNFITIGDVEAKGYQTAAQVEAAINTALGGIENGTY